jgi:hypothetical protein
MVVVAFLAGALTVGAIATATASFNDSGVSCGAAVSTALHGKQAVPIGGETGTSSLLAVTSENRQFLTGGLVGLPGVKAPATRIYTVCRQPARGRILVSAVLLATALVGIAFSARRSTRGSTREPTPVPA